jgi:hypothetical protein
MNILFIIIVIIGIFVIYNYFGNTYENFTNLSNEAIQNIASVYNKDNMIVTNLSATSRASIGNDTQHIDSLVGKNNAGEEVAQWGMISPSNELWLGPVGNRIEMWSPKNDVFHMASPKGGVWYDFGMKRIVPEGTETLSLGTSDRKWNEIYGKIGVVNDMHVLNSAIIHGTECHGVGTITLDNDWVPDGQLEDPNSPIGKKVYEYFNNYLNDKAINVIHTARISGRNLNNEVLLVDGFKMDAGRFMIRQNGNPWDAARRIYNFGGINIASV